MRTVTRSGLVKRVDALQRQSSVTNRGGILLVPKILDSDAWELAVFGWQEGLRSPCVALPSPSASVPVGVTVAAVDNVSLRDRGAGDKSSD